MVGFWDKIIELILRPASDNAQFMRPVIVNRFPTLDFLHQDFHKRFCKNVLRANGGFRPK